MKIANILSILLGTVLILIAAQWIFTPQTAAESLSMTFLEGDGRNTQIRDFTALFLSTSLMCYTSFFTKQYQWISCAGLVYLLAAIFNVLATNYDAPVAFSSLVSEVIFASMAFISAILYLSLIHI